MTGAERIAAERQRQIDSEGYTPEHDASHTDGELYDAAMAYIYATRGYPDGGAMFWPWDKESFKPSGDQLHNLVRAGALIAAEIDRILARDTRP